MTLQPRFATICPVVPVMFVALPLVVGGPAAMADTATADLTRPTLPTFALTTRPGEPSPWTGLYVGSEVFAFSGSKGVRGGFGGGGYAGYDRELDTGVVVGLQGSLGYVPGFYRQSRITGFEYGETSVRVGYDMGRFMPFVTAGVGLAQPNVRSVNYGGAANVATDLFNSTGDLRSFQTVGVGFAYKVTNRLTFEMAVQAFHGNGFVAP